MFQICNCILYLYVESQSDPIQIIWVGLLLVELKLSKLNLTFFSELKIL